MEYTGRKAQQLADIAAWIYRCEVCRTRAQGNQLVPGEGNPNAIVMFVGEAPGKTEAKTGRPFVGRAGKLLRKLISEIGLKDTEVFITSAVKYLPEYVTPKHEDIEHGRRHLFEQIEVVDPEIVVLLGGTAALSVLQEKVAIAKDHGRVIRRDGRTYVVAYHPAAPLYSKKAREELGNDFRKLKRLVNRL